MNRTRGGRRTETSDATQHGRRTRVQPGMTWPPALPFEQALQRAQASDQQAMGMLYKRFLPVVYRFALARVGDVHTAEDITSETFFAIVERIGETRAHDELTFVAWALGIARNQIAMHFRRLKARPVTPLSTYQEDPTGGQVGEPDPLDVMTARESLAEVVAALDRITEEQRSVILYRCVLGYSAEDVGKLLGKQPGAIRALQFRALASLARFLKHTSGEADEQGRASTHATHERSGEE